MKRAQRKAIRSGVRRYVKAVREIVRQHPKYSYRDAQAVYRARSDKEERPLTANWFRAHPSLTVKPRKPRKPIEPEPGLEEDAGITEDFEMEEAEEEGSSTEVQVEFA